MTQFLKINKYPHVPGVAAVDCVSTRQQYPWRIPLQNSEYKLSQLINSWGVWLASGHVIKTLFYVISATHCLCYMQCLGCRSKYLNIQNHLADCVIEWMGHYHGIPRICLSIFEFGWVFVLCSLPSCSNQLNSTLCTVDLPPGLEDGKQRNLCKYVFWSNCIILRMLHETSLRQFYWLLLVQLVETDR